MYEIIRSELIKLNMFKTSRPNGVGAVANSHFRIAAHLCGYLALRSSNVF